MNIKLGYTPPLLSLMTSCQVFTIGDQWCTSTSHLYSILQWSHCLPALIAALTSAACLVPCLIIIRMQYRTSGHLWGERHIVDCIYFYFFHLFYSFLMLGLRGGWVTTPPGNTLFMIYLKKWLICCCSQNTHGAAFFMQGSVRVSCGDVHA